MAASSARWSVDFAEYLRFEREAAERHELIDGEIGATRRHNMLCGRLHDAIRPSLGDGPCILERSDQRLAVETRIAPSLLVEVTSKTTEKKDRGVKLEEYLEVKALTEYLIVSHERKELELWVRTAEGWTRSLVVEGTLRLRGGAEIDVERLYEGLPP